MLRKVNLLKLFGNEDVNINFAKRSVIITGDNGNGKTTILNTIYNILMGDYSNILKTYFEKARVVFDSNFKSMDKIEIRRFKDQNEEKISIKYFHDENLLEVNLSKNNVQNEVLVENIIKKVDAEEIEIYNDGKNKKQLINSDRNISLLEILTSIDEQFFSEKLKEINKSLLYFPTYRRIDLDIDEYYASLFDMPIRAYIISEQRERNKKFGLYDRRVIGMSNSDIEDILKEYTRTLNEVSSNNLDRLLRDFTKNTMLEINSPLSGINTNKLQTVNILNQLKEINESLELEINEDTLKQISEQYDEKISVLNQLESKEKESEIETIKAFETLLSVPMMQVLQKLQEAYSNYNTKMTKALESYSYISENISDFSGNKLKLIKSELNEFYFKKIATSVETFSDFSTGEKQLITFLVYSSIELPDDTPSLIIIDEPELSLHVKWQNKLIKNLLKKKNIKVLSATHSPYIINRREVDSLVLRKVEG